MGTRGREGKYRQGRERGRVGKEAGWEGRQCGEGCRVGKEAGRDRKQGRKEAGMRKEAKSGRRQEGAGRDRKGQEYISPSAPSRKVLLPTDPIAVRHIFE